MRKRRKNKFTVAALAAAMALSLVRMPVLAAEDDVSCIYTESAESTDTAETEIDEAETEVLYGEDEDVANENTEEADMPETPDSISVEPAPDSFGEDIVSEEEDEVETEQTEESAEDIAVETSVDSEASEDPAISEKERNSDDSDYTSIPESDSNSIQMDNLGYQASVSVSPQIILADSDTGYILNMRVSGNAPVRIIFPEELSPIDKGYQSVSGRREVISNGSMGDVVLQFSLSKADAAKFIEDGGIGFYIQLPGDAGSSVLTVKVSAPPEDEIASKEDTPAEDETPSDEETPTEKETPAGDETPSEVETPTEEETPAENETPSEVEPTTEEETPAGDETPSEDDMPAEEKAPTREEAPAEEETPEISYRKETPHEEEMPYTEIVPSAPAALLPVSAPAEGFRSPHTGDYSAIKALGWLMGAMGCLAVLGSLIKRK